MREVMGRVFSEINQQNRIDNKSAFAAILSQGIELIKPDPTQLQEWRRYAEATTRQLIESGKISKDMLQSVERHLNNFRVQQK